MKEHAQKRKGEGPKTPFLTYKDAQLKVAKELGYPDAVIERIEQATTEAEIARAMIAGRRSIRDR